MEPNLQVGSMKVFSFPYTNDEKNEESLLDQKINLQALSLKENPQSEVKPSLSLKSNRKIQISTENKIDLTQFKDAEAIARYQFEQLQISYDNFKKDFLSLIEETSVKETSDCVKIFEDQMTNLEKTIKECHQKETRIQTSYFSENLRQTQNLSITEHNFLFCIQEIRNALSGFYDSLGVDEGKNQRSVEFLNQFQESVHKISELNQKEKVTITHITKKIECEKTKLNILIVEDNMINFKVLSNLLKKCGFTQEFTHAKDAALTLKVLNEPNHRFDLIFMDIHIPTTEGINLQGDGITAYLRENKFTMPIIACTGTSKADIKNVQNFNGYLDKPISKDKIETILNEIFTFL